MSGPGRGTKSKGKPADHGSDPLPPEQNLFAAAFGPGDAPPVPPPTKDPGKEATEQAEREQAEKAERQRREQAEREQAEKAERQRREQAEREQAEREQAEREQAEREQAEREQTEREQTEREQTEREQTEREQAEREQAEREERDAADGEANEEPIPADERGTFAPTTISVSDEMGARFNLYQRQEARRTGVQPSNIAVVFAALNHCYGRYSELWTAHLRPAPADGLPFPGHAPGRRIASGRRNGVQIAVRPIPDEVQQITDFMAQVGTKNRTRFITVMLDDFLPQLPANHRLKRK